MNKTQRVPTCPRCGSILHQYCDDPPLFQCMSEGCWDVTPSGKVQAKNVVWKDITAPKKIDTPNPELPFLEPVFTIEETNLIINALQNYKEHTIISPYKHKQITEIINELKREKIKKDVKEET